MAHQLIRFSQLSILSHECSICHENRRLFICKDCNNSIFIPLREKINREHKLETNDEKTLSDLLKKKNLANEKSEKIKFRRDRIKKLQNFVQQQEKFNKFYRARLQRERGEYEWRREALTISDSIVKFHQTKLLSVDLLVKLNSLSENYELKIRRQYSVLTKQLLKIFNIRRISSHSCSIASVVLADDLEFISLNNLSEEVLTELSFSFGLILHLTNIFCYWLKIHPPHKLNFINSHSQITFNNIESLNNNNNNNNNISNTNTNNTKNSRVDVSIEYSLHLTRSDSNSFHRALTLLALDIQFLCWSLGMTDVPLYRLLPNLMELCQAVSLVRTQRKKIFPQQKINLENKQINQKTNKNDNEMKTNNNINSNDNSGSSTPSRPIVSSNFADGDDEWSIVELEAGDEDDED